MSSPALAASQQAVVEAALVLLERMGLSPADLVTAPASQAAVPTFAEYVPVMSAAVSAGTRRAYGSYWNRIVEHWGDRRLDEPTPSEVRQLMGWVKTHVVTRMGTALAHMLRADAETRQALDSGTRPPATRRSLSWSSQDQDRPERARPETDRSSIRDQSCETPGLERGRGVTGPGYQPVRPQVDQARMVARRLAAAAKPVSRRALRVGGVRGSNEALNALARMINSEMAGAAPPRAPAS